MNDEATQPEENPTAPPLRAVRVPDPQHLRALIEAKQQAMAHHDYAINTYFIATLAALGVQGEVRQVDPGQGIIYVAPASNHTGQQQGRDQEEGGQGMK
jgi:hypothetical protein